MVYASFLLIALLYASVGQAGASGYIAVMALLEFAPESIKPTALVLNTLVSLLVTWRFMRSGRVDWKLLWPFALAAVPMALLGGALTLPVLCSGLMKPDTHLGENARQIEVSDDQTTPLLYS
ncbi:sulfite exporter TauE/SafE family protein [Pseudomonas sp. A-RE-26]|uniref:sulfite exporter TauE/SafE family protein n=1 Tax=Pseudomonas sp. A-RE-26 TaxID=2832402 RepID=UPI001CBEA4E1|nr:sulfite exporter TauE/SafE family protein [Pseudomonas sp. A-RE-26]